MTGRSTTSILVLLSAGSMIARDAHAAPSAVYNPVTGHLELTNDATAAALVFDSASRLAYTTNSANFTVASSLPGGVVFDQGDLPRGFTFLNLPAGVYDIGNVVVPTTPLADLQLFSYSNLLGSPISGEITDQSSGLRMQSAQ
jgi:hypothetical protein